MKESTLKDHVKEALLEQSIWHRKNAGSQMQAGGASDYEILRHGKFMALELKATRSPHETVKETTLLQVKNLLEVDRDGGVACILGCDGDNLFLIRVRCPRWKWEGGALYIKNELLLHASPSHYHEWGVHAPVPIGARTIRDAIWDVLLEEFERKVPV